MNFPALLVKFFMFACSVHLAKLFVLHEHRNYAFIFPHHVEQNFANSRAQVYVFKLMCCGQKEPLPCQLVTSYEYHEFLGISPPPYKKCHATLQPTGPLEAITSTMFL